MRALLLLLLFPGVAGAEILAPPPGWFVVEGDDGGKALPRDKAIFHEAYVALRKARVYAGEMDELEEPFYEYALVRQSLVREARFVHASGSGDGGHRDMSPRILVELDGAVWHVEAPSKNLDADGHRRRLTVVKACPLAFLRARALAFEGNPDLDKLAALERQQCRQLVPLIRAGLARQGHGGLRNVVKLLTALETESADARIVERDADVSEGLLRGRRVPGAKRPTLRAMSITGQTVRGHVELTRGRSQVLAAFTLEVAPDSLTLELRDLVYTVVIIE